MHNLVCLKLIETVESDLLDDTLFLYSLHLTMLPVWRGIHDDELIGLKNVILDLATFMSICLNWIIKSLFQKNVKQQAFIVLKDYMDIARTNSISVWAWWWGR